MSEREYRLAMFILALVTLVVAIILFSPFFCNIQVPLPFLLFRLAIHSNKAIIYYGIMLTYIT